MTLGNKWVYKKQRSADKEMRWQKAEQRRGKKALRPAVFNIPPGESSDSILKTLRTFQMQGRLNSLPALLLISQNPTWIFRHGILLLQQCWGIFPPMWEVVRLYFKGQHVNFSSINIQKMEYCIDIWYINKWIRTVE